MRSAALSGVVIASRSNLSVSRTPFDGDSPALKHAERAMPVRTPPGCTVETRTFVPSSSVG
jgi:hypothetical protein